MSEIQTLLLGFQTPYVSEDQTHRNSDIRQVWILDISQRCLKFYAFVECPVCTYPCFHVNFYFVCTYCFIWFQELIRLITMEDLRIAKTLCQPVFPPSYLILDHFIDLYHEALSNRVICSSSWNTVDVWKPDLSRFRTP